MDKFQIFETDTFHDDLEGLPSGVRAKVEAKLQTYVYPQLRLQPYYGPNIKKLKDWTPETWRYRIGTWRFFFEINEIKKFVIMTALQHRKDAYR